MRIEEVDRIEVTVLVDNYTDLLRMDNTPVVKRPSLPNGDVLLSEHGLSLYITLRSGGNSSSILMDAGGSNISLQHNAVRLGVSIWNITALVISHGHDDHMGSIQEILQHCTRPIPVYTHPAAFSNRQKRISEEPIRTQTPMSTQLPAASVQITQNPVTGGNMSIESVPAGSQVTMNGTIRGITPLTLNTLPGGQYSRMLEKTGYTPISRTVEIKYGHTTDLSLQMMPVPTETPIPTEIPKPVQTAVPTSTQKSGTCFPVIGLFSGFIAIGLFSKKIRRFCRLNWGFSGVPYQYNRTRSDFCKLTANSAKLFVLIFLWFLLIHQEWDRKPEQ